ncbi:hypothetical protein GF312_04805 [Candidatus Poribacteria bacterium]|nr:hypothetical protein [Candidatus Poribacteria bacterium]
MDIISKNQLRSLINEHGEICVSMYLPTSRTWPETQTNTARLKNVISKAEEQIADQGVRRPEVQGFLARAKELLENEELWRHPSDGLAIFLSRDRFDFYRLPLDFQELVFVGNNFHIKPLIPLFSNNGNFYILAISQNEVRFFRGTRHKIAQISPEDLPNSIKEVLKYDVPEKQIQLHTGTSKGSAQRAAMFHGQGAGKDNSKDRILEYFRLVDDSIHKMLKEEKAPLIFAGVDYLFPIYKEVNSYNNLLNKAIEGNPEELDEQEIHNKAWKIVQKHFNQKQEEAIQQYKEYKATEKITNDLRDIVPAAYYGKIDTLFVAIDLQRWGVYDPDKNSLEIHQQSQTGDYDLLDYAAVQTLLNGGTVYAVKMEHIPGRPPVAAIFRWQ